MLRMAVPRPASPNMGGSPSPPAMQQPTKRDIRRNRIMEKLQGIIDSFSQNQHQHYRAQLQAVQVDMALVLRADPYENGPLDDYGEDIRRMVEEMGAGVVINNEAAQRDFQALAGSRYRDFVRETNDALESRDAELTALHQHYKAAISDLERTTQQRLHQADEEYKALTSTIRQRLIATITKKRQQLLRDKDQLDIADSNALLLHPNQFSINTPGSPTLGASRKTRHLRHRATSPGNLENGKRKRKADAVDDDGNESPAPSFRLPPPDALGGGRSPFKDARAKEVYAQYEAPAYSLERLFTDKELAMASATAQQATYRYFHQPQDQGTDPDGTEVPSVHGEVLESAEQDDAAPTAEGVNGTPPPNQPVEMERTTSHQVLTRGGARANPLAALTDLATAAAASAPARDNPFAPVIPSYHAVARVEKSGAPPPSAVTALDVENDFEMMRQVGISTGSGADGKEDEEANEAAREMRRQLLDQALGNPTVTQPYRFPLLDPGPGAAIGRGVERTAQFGFAPSSALVESKLRAGAAASALSGLSAGGSLAAVFRGIGGEPMSRTTSAGGVSELGDQPRRGRGRHAA